MVEMWLYTLGRNLRIVAMHETNTALLDVLVDNFVIILSFQNPAKGLFVRFWKDGLLAELQARICARSCYFLLFLPHT